MPPSPTQRSLKECRRRGWPVEIVEHYDHYARRRLDLYGLGDLLALDLEGDGIILIQTTSGANHVHRAAKLRSHPNAPLWLSSPHRRLEIWSWSLRGARGKRKLWTLRVEPILLDELETEARG